MGKPEVLTAQTKAHDELAREAIRGRQYAMLDGNW
jgi:hypothetical protein